MTLDVSGTLTAARRGEPRAVGRLISAIENGSTQLPELASALAPHTGRSYVIGLTGAPGVGKSTCTAALISAYRDAGKRVAVLAVDPSSPFSGGALLGDRVRMQEFATDPDVYIRSMASRGHLGGLALAAPQALRVLDAVGFDIVLVETVGVGQGEVAIAGLADTVLVLVAPGMGDGIQAVKAGIAEIADIFVVNKADHDGADNTVRDLKNMLALGGRHSEPGSWRPMTVKTVAAAAVAGATGRAETSGITELCAAIDKHRGWLTTHAELAARRQARAAAEIENIVLADVGARLRENGLAELAVQVAAGDLDTYAAAAALQR